MERSLNSITQNLERIRENIAREAAACGRRPEEIRLMAVTKTVPAALVNHAVDSCGITLLGENRAQEMNEKYDDYHRDGVEIHFIGHLQTNKVRQVVGKVSMIESVDSLKLTREIDRAGAKLGITTDVLLEINIAGELSKSGVEPGAAEALAREIAALEHVKLRGLMTIPPICGEIDQINRYFSQMQALKVDIEGKNIDNINMEFLSMGMSEDYPHAIRHGANILRLGSAIFGNR